MATPHVAGAAALLKSLHHDWTPAQIKLALMNNATLLHDEIMAGGAGRIDVFAAATGPIRIDPPSISLGLAPLELNNWTDYALAARDEQRHAIGDVHRESRT